MKHCPYQCPKTKNFLEYNGISIIKDIQYRQYSTNKCKKCPYHDKCTSQEKRTLYQINESEIQHIIEYYQSEIGQKNYSFRGIYSEGNFAILREARKYREIKVRGITKTETELTRTTIIHNIKKK